jgi:hypothetical protein
MEAFLVTIEAPMVRQKARNALEMQVCLNGGEFLTRAAIIERRVTEGATLRETKSFGRVLERPDGAFLDARNITATGLRYAEWLIGQRGR